ncbi:MAG TPA: hypothetical protein VHF44_03340 [Nitrososphaeraceae archaeon]|nr:hypothetical protein [Nitrososphaeraceae archaeon]
MSTRDDDPFSNWAELIHKPVYSIDGKKLGFLSKVLSDYMFVGRGFINLVKYLIPKSFAESVSKKGIRLSITAYEVHSKYSYTKMKHAITNFGILPETVVGHRTIYDRFQTLRYHATRNRFAAVIAFVSGILFLISGYKANLAMYDIIRQEVMIYTARELWAFLLAPVGILAMLSQFGGITVLVGAALFLVNRVTLGKFLVFIGTGQGLFTIALRIWSEIWSGRIALENNYITSLTSSAVGLGVLFAVLAQSIPKGWGETIVSRGIRYIFGKED